MVYETIIFGAAKKAGVSFSLLFAICSHESAHFTDIYVHQDGGSPSVGICMVKEGTAKMLGFTGTLEELKTNHDTNAYYAAKYLKYQEERYGSDWVKIAAAYNAGSYTESKVVPGCPRNLRYIRRIQKELDDDLKPRLECGAN